MGKKGGWFSAIKRVFTHSSKEKPTNGSSSDKKSSKEKRKGKGILKHGGESKSFIPLFREPSSIEKILGEADQLLLRHPTSSEQPKPPPPPPSLQLARPTSPTVGSPRTGSRRLSISSPKANSPIVSSPRVVSPKAPSPPRGAISPPRGTSSPKVALPRIFTPAAASSSSKTTAPAPAPAPKVTKKSRKEISYAPRTEPTLRNQHHSATMIQAAYRGYLARRSFRALRGLVRLQGVVRGQNVKRQTMNAMKQMQLLVRVQTQIQSRRIQMLENQALQHRNDKEVESTLSKWTQLTGAGQSDDWDDSALTKEEVEARMRKKVEAVIKRERAMAYAYSHQLWKSNNSKSTPLDIRANGYPWWWNWLERQLPPASTSHQSQAPTKNFSLTPPRPISEYKPSPRLQTPNYKNTNNFTFDNHDQSLTPRSSKSTIPSRVKHFQTPNRTPPTTTKHSKPRASPARSAYDLPLKDDDSLMSCPPFSVPNYMAPTVSAKAKVRANSNPKERSLQGTPSNDSKRRFSFPLTPNIGSFKWNNKGKDSSSSQKVMEKHQSSHSIGDLSVDSTVSMPATVGRKPFNRFV